MKLILKKNVNIMNVFNVVAVSWIPVTCACIVNIVLAFIWTGFISVFNITGFVAMAILLYAGMQKLEKLTSSPFLCYVGIWATMMMLVKVIQLIVAEIMTSSAAYSVYSVMDMLS